MTLLEVRGLRTDIDTAGGTVRPVDGVSFAVAAGETVGLVGESGSGKTMTGMSVMALLPPGGRIAGGSISLDGRELVGLASRELRRLRGAEVAMVFQDPMTSLNPTRTIGNQLVEAYRIHRGGSVRAARARAVEVLDLVGMARPAERLDDHAHQLSGGMRQRAMIALALVCEPKLLIADEPTTALDVSIQAQILALLDDLKTRLHMGVLLVTHDLGVIAGHAQRVLVMYGGRIVEEASTPDLFAHPRHRYTEALLESMPTLDLDRSKLLATIPGAPPSLRAPAAGCRFAPRCRFSGPDCVAADPPLVEVRDGHRHRCVHPAGGVRGGGAAVVGAVVLAGGAADGPGPTAPGPVVGERALLELVDIHKEFPVASTHLRGDRAVVHAVSGVTLEVLPGETLGIVGESGSGKTTLGRMMAGLSAPTRGAVRFDGVPREQLSRRELRRRRRDVQLMFQDSYAALDPRMTVAQSIAEPLAAQHVGSRGERRRRVAELLADVGLPPDAGDRYPHEFSGGQRQRIGLARALALRPRLLVADEPVSALDVSIQAQILNLIRGLREKFKLTVVVVSHDLSLLKYLSDRVAVMYLGKLVEIGPSDAVYGSPRHPYTAGLIDTVPLPDPAMSRAVPRVAIRGEIPSAIDPPSGCRFRTRCPLAQEVCATTEPLLAAAGGGQPGPHLHAAACHFPLRGEGPSVEHRLMVTDSSSTATPIQPRRGGA